MGGLALERCFFVFFFSADSFEVDPLTDALLGFLVVVVASPPVDPPGVAECVCPVDPPGVIEWLLGGDDPSPAAVDAVLSDPSGWERSWAAISSTDS